MKGTKMYTYSSLVTTWTSNTVGIELLCRTVVMCYNFITDSSYCHSETNLTVPCHQSCHYLHVSHSILTFQFPCCKLYCWTPYSWQNEQIKKLYSKSLICEDLNLPLLLTMWDLGFSLQRRWNSWFSGVAALRNVVIEYQHFGGLCCLHLQGWSTLQPQRSNQHPTLYKNPENHEFNLANKPKVRPTLKLLVL